IRKRNRGRVAVQHARKVWPHRDSTERRSAFFWNGFEGAIQPAVFGGFQARRARLHEVLRVKMRAGGIGRTGSVHDSKLILVKQRLKGREAWMQAEKSVEVDGGIVYAALRRRNRNAGAHAVVIGFAERHDDVQSIRGTPLKEHDELLLVRHGRSSHG